MGGFMEEGEPELIIFLIVYRFRASETQKAVN